MRKRQLAPRPSFLRRTPAKQHRRGRPQALHLLVRRCATPRPPDLAVLIYEVHIPHNLIIDAHWLVHIQRGPSPLREDIAVPLRLWDRPLKPGIEQR